MNGAALPRRFATRTALAAATVVTLFAPAYGSAGSASDAGNGRSQAVVLSARPPEGKAPGASTTTTLWTPQVMLDFRPDGAVLTAVTHVPTGCERAAGSATGFPDGTVGIPEALAVQLEVHRETDRACTTALSLVAHRLEKIDLAGRTNLLVYVVADGKVMGQTHVSFGALERSGRPEVDTGAPVPTALNVEQACGSTCSAQSNIACGSCAITCAVGKASVCTPGQASCSTDACTCRLQPSCVCK
jgi:hypothetical protein